jgi:hypothetical protein
VVVSLHDWWRRFDALGRKFINYSNPVFGSAKQEQEFLAEARQQQKNKREQQDG